MRSRGGVYYYEVVRSDANREIRVTQDTREGDDMMTVPFHAFS